MGFWGGKERRKYARILRTVPCKLKVGNETLAGSTQNISESGVLIEMYSAPDTLDAVVGQDEVALPRPREEVAVDGLLDKVALLEEHHATAILMPRVRN